MGAGVSVRESVRTYSQDGSGVMPLNRSGLSLEKAASWSQDDVRTALRAVQDSESVMLLLPVLARASADGKFLLSVSEDELEVPRREKGLPSLLETGFVVESGAWGASSPRRLDEKWELRHPKLKASELSDVRAEKWAEEQEQRRRRRFD